MKLIIIAPSGGGKGTQAEFLCRDFGGIPHISTGDIFRSNMAEKTPLGIEAAKYVNSGTWVPDDITNKMLIKRISEADCKKGFLLDGYPRTLNQARLLSQNTDVDVVLELSLTDQMVLDRLACRWTCKDKACNTIHNSQYEATDKCKKCGGELFQREDDKPETILKRLKQYREQNKDILDFYARTGKLITIDVKPEYLPEDTYAAVTAAFKKKGIV